MTRLWIPIRMTMVLTVLTGIVYPLAIAGLGHLLFPFQANGSIIYRNGRPVGSALIGQNFSAPDYFHPRPSRAGDKGYDAADSAASNLGPTNKAQIDAVRLRLNAIVENNPGVSASQVPMDMVTASASGLDPDISPADAELQIARVAKARGMSEQSIAALVGAHERGRWAGLFGEPRINVLELNLALEAAAPTRHASFK
jgi:K+-transporting ATPase ATPase C chain